VTDLPTLDRVFAAVMTEVVRTGRAPHYTDLARDLGLGIEDARQAVHDVMAAGYPGWMHPQTDLIASWPPFNILPTQYRITVDGRSLWTAQCGFESLAVRWMFPGRVIRVDAPCLDCGEPISLEMRDEQLLSTDPDGIVGYAWGSVGGALHDRPLRCAGMHLFRNEEHARAWTHFNPETADNLQPLAFWVDVFSGGMFRNRTRPDFLSWLRTDEGKASVTETIGKLPVTNWTPPAS
jgi:hypothetical protein